MSATLRVLPPEVDAIADGRAGTSRMISRREVSPLLISPVPISVPPIASTTRPPIAPETRFEAAVGLFGGDGERRGVGVRTGISGTDCRAWRGAGVRAILHPPRKPAPGAV